MAFEFKLPDVGEGISEGVIVKWRVKPGDKIKEDDVVADVETDKAIVEIPSPKSGTVTELKHEEGDEVKVGDVLLVLREAGEKVSSKKEKPKKQDKSVGVIGSLEEAPDEDEEEAPTPKKTPKKYSSKEVKALPAVRAKAKELGIDLSTVEGSGPGGRVELSDLGQAPVKKGPAKKTRKYDMYGYLGRIPFKGIRKVIAKNMMASQQNSAFVTHMDEADVTDLWAIRKKEKEIASKQGIKLTFLPFIIKALVAGLEQEPLLNASLDLDEGNIILKKYFNIGIGVDTESGLMVPVLKRVKEKSILDMAKEIDELAEKARTRKIDLADLKGSTVTITNVGSLGGIFSTPIINPPNSSILGVHRIRKMPRVVNDEIVPRYILPLTMTFDHRIADGANAARCMNQIIRHLEDPDLMLIES